MNVSKKVRLLLPLGFVSILSFILFKNVHTEQSEVIFCAPTKEEAFDQALFYIRRLPFYIQNNYRVDLPKHKILTELYLKPEPLSDCDLNYLKNMFYTEIYDSTAYDKGLKEVQKTRELVEASFEKLAVLHENWDFKLMQQYKVILTLYGPGGSYDPSIGQIIIKTTSEGIKLFDPEETIIHEIVHIGIQENIVQMYNLTQNEKERLVDLICSIYLKELLPLYKMQERGDKNVDSFVTEEAIKKNLPAAIKNYVKQYPR